MGDNKENGRVNPERFDAKLFDRQYVFENPLLRRFPIEPPKPGSRRQSRFELRRWDRPKQSLPLDDEPSTNED